MKKKSNLIAGLLLGLVLLMLMVRYSNYKNTVIDRKATGNAMEKEQSEDTGEEVEAFIPPSRYVTLEDGSVVSNGIKVSILNQTISSELPEEIEKKYVVYFDESCDEKGKLEEGFKYVFFEIELENTNDDVKEIYLNSIIPSYTDDEGKLFEPVIEMRYRSGYEFEGNQYPKDYFKIAIKEKEIYTVTVGYILSKEFMDERNLCLAIDFTGNWMDTSMIKCIRVEVKQE